MIRPVNIKGLGGRHTRALAPLVVVFLATGFATALSYPFLTFFLTDAVHATKLQISVFLIAQPLSGVVMSSAMGRLSDGRFQRRHVLLVAALAACAGAASLAVLRDYYLLLALACTVNAVGAAVMPQGFAYAHTVLAGDSEAAMLTSTLRTFFSVAWVAGPPLAAVLLDVGDFKLLFTGAALFYVVVAAVAAFWLVGARPLAASTTAEKPIADLATDASARSLWLTIAGLVAISASLNANVQAMPLHIQENLDGRVRDVGLVLGLCAAIEIPAMLGFGMLSRRFPLRTLVRLGPIVGAVYFALAAAATEVWHLAAAQVLNACYIAIVGGLAISYVQDLLPSQPGRASTLYSNTFPLGAMLAAPLLGYAKDAGYRMPYVAALGLTLIGFVLIVAGAGREASLHDGELAAVGLPVGPLEGG